MYPESRCDIDLEDKLLTWSFLSDNSRKIADNSTNLCIWLLLTWQGRLTLLAEMFCSRSFKRFPPRLLNITKSFHTNMKSTVCEGETSEPFSILSGVKQGYLIAPTLFGILFSLLLSHEFKSSTNGVYLHNRHDGKPFNLNLVRAKIKPTRVLLRDILFADDSALQATLLMVSSAR